MFWVAGEASADLQASGLLRELMAKLPEAKFYGVGGTHCRKAGLEVLVPAESFNVMGLAEWWGKKFDLLKSYRKLVRDIRQSPPDFAVLVDLPDVNLRLAKVLKAQKVPVFYYFSPQVWAWRKYRVHHIRKFVDRMLVVFPFEQTFYEREQVKAIFVGHPMMESDAGLHRERSQSEIVQAPRIAILPGSRESEVHFHRPLIEETAKDLKDRYPQCEIRIPIAPTLSRDLFGTVLENLGVKLVEESSHSVMAWADVGAVASGTATLEAAVIGLPFVLFYRVSHSSFMIFKYLVRYGGFIGMPNVILQKKAVEELFQADATPDRLTGTLVGLIEDENQRRQMREDFVRCRELLNPPSELKPTAFAAAQILNIVGDSIGLA